MRPKTSLYDQHCSLRACVGINGAPSEHSLISLLKACTDLNKGRVIHALACKNGKDSDAYVASCLVNMYAKLGSIGEARLVFDGMRYHDVVSWTALVQGYAANGEGRTALELFAQMQCHGFFPNARTLVAALKACTGSSDVLQMIQAIQAQASMLGLCMDLLITTTLVDVYAKCSCLRHACRVFSEMHFHDLVAWNALMFGYVENGEAELAVQLLAEMALSHCAPSSRSFIAALKACTCLAAKGSVLKANSLTKVRAIHSQASRHLDNLLSNTLVDVYAKCGSIKEARRVFDKMPTPDVVSWTALILGYVENGEYMEALELFARSTCAPNSVVFLAVTRACVGLAADEVGQRLQDKIVKVDALQRGRAAEDQASRTGCDSDIVFKNSLIDMYGKCGSMSDAWRVFNSMCEHDVVSWNSLLFGYVDNGDWDLALHLFSRLLLGGFTPNARTLVAASKACTSLAALEREGMQVDRKQLRRASLPLQRGYAIHSMSLISCLDTESVLSSCLIDMYSKAGSLEDAHRVFDYTFQPDLASWTSLMLGYAENGEGKVALELFGQMQRQSMVPDSRAYVAALKACNVETALETGRGIHMDIRRLHPEMETETYLASALVDFYCKCGSMVDAEAVFSKVSPKNLVTWNTLMAGYGRNGYPDRVLEKFHEMRDEGLRPDRVTFLCVLTACSHAGLLGTGKECFESMELKYGVVPDVEHYTCMVDLLGRVNEIEAAVAMLKRMPCKPDGVTWRSLLASCRKWKNVEVAKRAFQVLLKESDEMDASDYLLMANTYDDGLTLTAK